MLRKKLKNYLIENKVFYSGFVITIIIFSIILGFYCNTATQLNDGWLDLYSNSLLNGGYLYKDINFPLLPFPIFLFTLITKIFGEKMIISHIFGAILKLCILGVFYTLLQKFFGSRNALCGTIISGITLIAIIYDSCVFSYNDLMYFLGLLSTLLLIDEISKLSEGKSNILYPIFIGSILGIMLISKQTHGIVIPFAILTLQFLAIIKYKNFKQSVKYTIITILPIIVLLGILYFYLAQTNTLTDFYNNVIGGISSKGNANKLIFHHFKILADETMIWVVYLAFCIFLFIFSATKNLNNNFQEHKNKYDNLLTVFTCSLLSLIIIISAYIGVYLFGNNIFDFHLYIQIDKFFKQICSIGFVTTDILCFYLFFDYLFEKNTNKNKFLFFIFIAMIFALNYAIMLSKPLPNLAFFSIGILTAWGLQQETPYYKLKNTLIYLFIATTLFLGTSSKIICPTYWHNWIADCITGEKQQVENVPFLKGMKLPKQEAEFFREIRNISDKYTNKNDEIYCFLNNQLFYKILDRPAFTKNVNLYFDLCSDEKAIADMQKILSNPPKMIIWLKFPEYQIAFHEYLFRNGKKSGQRDVNNAIENMVNNKKYKIIKKYENKYSDFENNFEKFITDKNDLIIVKSINKEIKDKDKIFSKIKTQNYEKIYAHNKKIEELLLKKAEFIFKYEKELDIEHYRYFIPPDYKLFVLIRDDIYKNKLNTKL